MNKPLILAPAGPGPLLAAWRRRRRFSQLDLALAAGISTKHLSFVETGRARPSRPVLISLAVALDLTPRALNEILLAAGLAPEYRETPLDHPALSGALGALALILGGHDPLPALAFDRDWDIVMINRAYRAWRAEDLPPSFPVLELISPPRPNLLETLFAPDGYRRLILNWEPVAAQIHGRVRQDLATEADPTRRRRLELLCAGAPPAALGAPDPVLTLVVRSGPVTMRLLNTVATLGTWVDLTLGELRIEFFHPADAASAAMVAAAAEAARIEAEPGRLPRC